jgi:hypothetical protein
LQACQAVASPAATGPEPPPDASQHMADVWASLQGLHWSEMQQQHPKLAAALWSLRDSQPILHVLGCQPSCHATSQAGCSCSSTGSDGVGCAGPAPCTESQFPQASVSSREHGPPGVSYGSSVTASGTGVLCSPHTAPQSVLQHQQLGMLEQPAHSTTGQPQASHTTRTSDTHGVNTSELSTDAADASMACTTALIVWRTEHYFAAMPHQDPSQAFQQCPAVAQCPRMRTAPPCIHPLRCGIRGLVQQCLPTEECHQQHSQGAKTGKSIHYCRCVEGKVLRMACVLRVMLLLTSCQGTCPSRAGTHKSSQSRERCLTPASCGHKPAECAALSAGH